MGAFWPRDAGAIGAERRRAGPGSIFVRVVEDQRWTLRAVGIVYRKELLDSLRDGARLFSMIVVPVLVMPLLDDGPGHDGGEAGQAKRGRKSPKSWCWARRFAENAAALRALKTIELGSRQPRTTRSDFRQENPRRRRDFQSFDAALESGETATVEIYVLMGAK